MKTPAIRGKPTCWHVIMESSMSTLSKAAVASKSGRNLGLRFGEIGLEIMSY